MKRHKKIIQNGSLTLSDDETHALFTWKRNSLLFLLIVSERGEGNEEKHKLHVEIDAGRGVLSKARMC